MPSSFFQLVRNQTVMPNTSFEKCKDRNTAVHAEKQSTVETNNESKTGHDAGKEESPSNADSDVFDCDRVVKKFLNSQVAPNLKNSEIIKYALMTLIDNGL